MWFGWMMTAALAQVPTCEKVGLGAVIDVEAPAVIVLGERRGIWPDVLRAERVVGALSRRGPVTVAVESVAADKQPVLDQFADGKIGLRDVPELAGWTEYWRIPWSAYEGLFALGPTGVRFTAVGVDKQIRPADERVPMPPGYLHVLLDAMGEQAMPVELEPEFIEQVAWRDHRLARGAIASWSGEGYLVILVDRLHVEGGKGVSWQAQQLTEHPVSSVLLANAHTPCYPTDRVWKDHPLDR